MAIFRYMSDMDNKQEIQKKGKHGGARVGGGRPVGSSNKPRIADFMPDNDIKELMERYLERAKVEDKVMIHLIENVLGKARQNIGLDGGEEDKPIAILNEIISSHNSNEESSEPK